ncbi:hypothetical protein TREES_T100001712 [Tupaia chinensis]|uniref:Uncharacterized protein n=1 Tax=Tupaia chinensis TaxID=246437 RepID=L9KK93_TUPCH|nr:hypothetical protein TREES_T100001712 [Tupaia chinensis]
MGRAPGHGPESHGLGNGPRNRVSGDGHRPSDPSLTGPALALGNQSHGTGTGPRTQVLGNGHQPSDASHMDWAPGLKPISGHMLWPSDPSLRGPAPALGHQSHGPDYGPRNRVSRARHRASEPSLTGRAPGLGTESQWTGTGPRTRVSGPGTGPRTSVSRAGHRPSDPSLRAWHRASDISLTGRAPGLGPESHGPGTETWTQVSGNRGRAPALGHQSHELGYGPRNQVSVDGHEPSDISLTGRAPGLGPESHRPGTCPQIRISRGRAVETRPQWFLFIPGSSPSRPLPRRNDGRPKSDAPRDRRQARALWSADHVSVSLGRQHSRKDGDANHQTQDVRPCWLSACGPSPPDPRFLVALTSTHVDNQGVLCVAGYLVDATSEPAAALSL